MAACGRLMFETARSDADLDASISTAIDAPMADGALQLSSCLVPRGGVASLLAAPHSQSVALAPPLAILGLSDGPQGIQVVDVSNPDAPTLRGTLLTSTGPAALSTFSNDVLGVKIQGGYAYLTTYIGGLVIVDLADPDAPTFVGGVNLPSESWGLAVNGSFVFVANYELGLAVIDVSNPATPTLVFNVQTPDLAHDVRITGNRAYVAYPTGIDVFDISNPRAPVRINRATTVGTNLYEVWSPDNKYAYAVDKLGRSLLAFDMQVMPAALVYTSPPDPLMQYRAIAGDADVAFVSTRGSTEGVIQSFHLATPTQPVTLAPTVAAGRVYQIAVVGDLLAAAMYDNGGIQLWRRQSQCP
jgi:hypothetical protein